jgi:predicted ArsR family transcriptional regulator
VGIIFDAIADPVRLRMVRRIDEHGPASLNELADAAGVHVNTARPHVAALEERGVLVSRQRAARGPGRRVIEYYLAEPLAFSESDFIGVAELLAAALARARLDPDSLRAIGADWGRYLSGRPADRDPDDHLSNILGRLGYRVQAGSNVIRVERCLCPLVAPDAPEVVCCLMDGVVEGALAASGGRLRLDSSEHDPAARSCCFRLARR